MALQDLLNQMYSGEDAANRRMQGMPTITPEVPAPAPPPVRPIGQPESGNQNLGSILPLLLAQQHGGQGGGGGGGGGLSGAGMGNTPSGPGIFGNSSVDVLGANDPRLVNIGGTQLARPAARSLRGILQDLGLQGSDVGGGYRSPAEQVAIHNAKPGLAADPGSSYHQEGLAIDLAAALQNKRFEQAMAQSGWNRFSPGGEPWHWSYGVTG